MPGSPRVRRRLEELNASMEDIGTYFITHEHRDHLFQWPEDTGAPLWQRTENRSIESGIEVIRCPGHAPDLYALRFSNESGNVWVVEDAILNRVWLMAWAYFWPNGYSRSVCLRKHTHRRMHDRKAPVTGEGLGSGSLGSCSTDSPSMRRTRRRVFLAAELRKP